MSQTDDHKRLQHLEAGMADAHDEKSTPVEEPRRKYGIMALPAPARHAVFFLLGIGVIMSLVCYSGAAAEAASKGKSMWYGQGKPACPNDIEAPPPSEAGDVFVLEEVIEVLKDGAPSKANRVAELHRRQDNGGGNTTPTASVPVGDTTTAVEPTTETTTVVETSSEDPQTTLTTTDPPPPDTTATSEPPTSTLTSTIVEDPTSTVQESTTTVIPTSGTSPSTSDEPSSSIPSSSTLPSSSSSTSSTSSDVPDPTSVSNRSSTSESPDESETTSEPDTTREAPTTSAITGTITSVLPDGRTTTITSTSVVDVDPTAEATQDPSDDPDLQNASPHLVSGNMIALTVAMVAGVILVS
jgi:hypothetical protein